MITTGKKTLREQFEMHCCFVLSGVSVFPLDPARPQPKPSMTLLSCSLYAWEDRRAFFAWAVCIFSIRHAGYETVKTPLCINTEHICISYKVDYEGISFSHFSAVCLSLFFKYICVFFFSFCYLIVLERDWLVSKNLTGTLWLISDH